MISREEAKDYEYSLDVDGYYYKDVEDMIDKIYDSIGSCGECKYKEHSECLKLSTAINEFTIVDNFYCSYFERKEPCGT